MFAKVERLVGVACISCCVALSLVYALDLLLPHISERFRDKGDFLFPKEVYFEPHPYTMFGGSHDPEIQAANGLNSLGYRGPVPAMPKPLNEYRIVLLGGSTVLNGSPPLSELLERYFHQSGRNEVKFYNFGVAASTLRMDIARLVFEVWNYHPDLVIFYGGGNDIGMPFQADPRPGNPPNFLAYEENPLLTAGTTSSMRQYLLLLLLHSRVVRALFGPRIKENLVSLNEVRVTSGWGTEEWSKRIAEGYLTDVRRAMEIGRGFRTQVYFVFQPILAFKPHQTPQEHTQDDPGLHKHALLCRSIITEKLREYEQSLHLSWLDLSSIFDSVQQEVYLDGVHVNQEYQPPIAVRIFEAIRGYGEDQSNAP